LGTVPEGLRSESVAAEHRDLAFVQPAQAASSPDRRVPRSDSGRAGRCAARRPRRDPVETPEKSLPGSVTFESGADSSVFESPHGDSFSASRNSTPCSAGCRSAPHGPRVRRSTSYGVCCARPVLRTSVAGRPFYIWPRTHMLRSAVDVRQPEAMDLGADVVAARLVPREAVRVGASPDQACGGARERRLGRRCSACRGRG